jgi:hypothetical protein
MSMPTAVAANAKRITLGWFGLSRALLGIDI